MFEAAELGRKLSKSTYKKVVPPLREALLSAQGRLRKADTSVIVVLAGVDGAGKGETVNLLNEWMDPRWVETRAYHDPTEDERERPLYWRYWRGLPAHGHVGFVLSSWYHQPLLDRVTRNDVPAFEQALDDVLTFEQMLADDGTLIIKFWMHLGKQAQEARFKALEADPLQKWRVTEKDWENWNNYDAFVAAAERLITRTSTGVAPWHLVEGADAHYRSHRVGTLLLEAIERHLETKAAPKSKAKEEGLKVVPEVAEQLGVTVLDQVDLKRVVGKKAYRDNLTLLQARLNYLHRLAMAQGRTLVMVFEGWDAGGKGGAIRRAVAAMDVRYVNIVSVAAPTDEEKARHYLWRFWRHIPRKGRVVVFDRSWYGRVLVERVEGFAQEPEWRRAYAEINDFERQLVESGCIVQKFWLHISEDEQLERFEARANTPYKAWKLTDEDWRNRERWGDYKLAAHDMIERTSTATSRWHLIPGNDKKTARLEVLQATCNGLAVALGEEPMEPAFMAKAIEELDEGVTKAAKGTAKVESKRKSKSRAPSPPPAAVVPKRRKGRGKRS